VNNEYSKNSINRQASVSYKAWAEASDNIKYVKKKIYITEGEIVMPVSPQKKPVKK